LQAYCSELAAVMYFILTFALQHVSIATSPFHYVPENVFV